MMLLYILPPGLCLNESPPEKEGKFHRNVQVVLTYEASMKALPKRKGNPATSASHAALHSLNESPPEKEGKFCCTPPVRATSSRASMKALPKRKGNLTAAANSL